jgi:hypothetical protein
VILPAAFLLGGRGWQCAAAAGGGEAEGLQPAKSAAASEIAIGIRVTDVLRHGASLAVVCQQPSRI